LEFINALLVYEFLAHTNMPEGADAIFILGSGSLGPVRKAVELYKSGFAKHICFTSLGGTFGGNIVFGESEIEIYRNELRRLRVPTRSIHSPPAGMGMPGGTTNTLAEAQAALPFMETVLPRKPSRIILCSRSVHQRRAWATFCKQNPGILFTNAPDGELLTVELLPRLVQEVDRLREYGAKGDLDVQAIPDEVAETVEKLRAYLAK
jgi:hypothetical protein